jgi:GT2 family glycosyltransferase
MAEELCQIEFIRSYSGRPTIVFARLFDQTGATVLAFPWRLDRRVTRTPPMMLDSVLTLEIVSGEPDEQVSARFRPCGSGFGIAGRAVTQAKKYARAFRNYLNPVPLDDAAGRIKPWAARPDFSRSCTVSIVIPTRDKAELLGRAIETLFERSDWPNKELIIVDNGSIELETFRLFERVQTLENVSIVRDDQPFNFARLINVGARASRGDVLAIMNNDVETDRPDYISRLVALACDPEVGVVGAKLLFADGSVQHAGIALGIRALTGHPGVGHRADVPGPYNMLAITRRVSAVTGACMFSRREVFERLGGFSEEYVVEFNDVDYCLRAGGLGLAVVYDANSILTHNEGSSRQVRPLREQEIRDRQRFVQEWGRHLINDPYYPADLTINDESLAFASVYDR